MLICLGVKGDVRAHLVIVLLVFGIGLALLIKGSDHFVDAMAAAVVAVMTLPALIKGRTMRVQGGILLAVYAGYLALLF